MRREILEGIERGDYPVGTLLPPEKELAERHGVSRPTVRKALDLLVNRNGLQKLPNRGVMVPAELAIKGNGPDVRGKDGTVGLVLAVEQNAFIMDIRAGLGDYAAQHGLEVRTFLSREGPSEAIDLLENFDREKVHGAVVMPCPTDRYKQALRGLSERRVGVVCVDRTIPEARGAGSVQSDNSGGMYTAVRHLIERRGSPVHYLGYRLDHSAVRDRYEGYKQAMWEAGYWEEVEGHTKLAPLRGVEAMFWPIDKKFMMALKAAEELLEEVDAPLAVACVNDYVAQAVYEAARRRDLQVGEDVLVTGFDDLPLTRSLDPPMTTVRQHARRMGWEAGRMVRRLIRKEASRLADVYLPVEFIRRGST